MAKKIPCPCQQIKIRTNVWAAPKSVDSILPFFSGSLRLGIEKVAQTLTGAQTPKTSGSLLKEDGKQCERCGGSGQIEDPTDTATQAEAAANAIKSKQQEIQKLEQQMGAPGGNRHQIIVGNELLEVGLGINSAKSYSVKQDAGVNQTTSITKKGVVPNVGKSNQVIGANPISAQGGHYMIKCSNKFTLFTGAQGIDISSYGPVSIKGGITKIFGPEITIGSSSGQVTVEGHHLQLGGKSINISPDPDGKGQLTIQGTTSMNGNLITQGGAHIEGDLSFISATCPKAIKRTKYSSATHQTTEEAVWQFEAAQQGLKDFLRNLQIKIQDPAATQLSPRETSNTLREQISLLQKTLPIEIKQTGIALMPSPTGVIPIPVYNYPHHHKLKDGSHTHEMEVPNIQILDNDQEVRKTAARKESIAPASANRPNDNDPIAIAATVLQTIGAQLV